MPNNVQRLLDDVFAISEREAARWYGATHNSVVNRWKDSETPPVRLCRVFGVRYDWLIGESTTIWSDSIVALKRQLRHYLATLSFQTQSPSQRFRIVTSFLVEQAPETVTVRFLSAILRMTDRHGNIATYLDMAQGMTPVSDSALRRLSEWSEIPYEWFVTGERRHIEGDAYSAVADEAKALGVTAEDLRAAMMILATSKGFV